MAENHTAGRVTMGQVRKAAPTEVGEGWFKPQTLQGAARLIWLAAQD